MFALRKKTLPWFPIETIERTGDGNPPASFADLLAFRLNFGRFKLWIAARLCRTRSLQSLYPKVIKNDCRKRRSEDDVLWASVQGSLCEVGPSHFKIYANFFIFSKFIFLGWRCLLLWITLLGFLGRIILFIPRSSMITLLQASSWCVLNAIPRPHEGQARCGQNTICLKLCEGLSFWNEQMIYCLGTKAFVALVTTVQVSKSY